MKRVPRTVSEVGAKTPNPRPLADYREEPALALIGDAGSGKTTEFRRERDAMAKRGEFVTARGFINLGCDADLTEKTLFIDGLDEVRAGVRDRRKPLDAIREAAPRPGPSAIPHLVPGPGSGPNRFDDLGRRVA